MLSTPDSVHTSTSSARTEERVMGSSAQHERKRESRAVRLSTNGRESHGQFRLSTNGKGNARQLSSPVRPEPRRRVRGSGGRIVVVEHAGLRSYFDKLSTNGRESHGQFGSARTEERESRAVRLSTNGRESHGQFGSARYGKGNARQLSSPVRPEPRRRVSGSGGRIVVVEHAGLRSYFDRLSTNGR